MSDYNVQERINTLLTEIDAVICTERLVKIKEELIELSTHINKPSKRAGKKSLHAQDVVVEVEAEPMATQEPLDHPSPPPTQVQDVLEAFQRKMGELMSSSDE